MQNEPDVIVIGAGVAGLAAAGALARQGWNVRLLEARSRIGGRVYPLRPQGWPRAIELGAEFVHGGNRALRAVLKRTGAQLQPVAVNMWRAEDGALTLVPDYWEKIGRVAEQIPRRDEGWSFRQFLWHRRKTLSPQDRTLAAAYAGSFNAASTDRLSAHALRAHRAGADTEDSKLVGSYATVLRGLRRAWPRGRVDLRLNAVVTMTRWERGAVEIVTRTTVGRKAATHRARVLVCTLPLGVFKAGRVRFSPPLRARDRLAARAGWGQVVRILFRFRRGFWSAPLVPAALGAKSGHAFGFVNAPGQPVPVWWALHPPAPILTGWAGGDLADELGRLPRAQQVARAVESLAHILNTSIRELRRWLVDWAMHDWRRDPFALGAYSYPVAGHDDLAERLAEPVAGTLFFAGEALAEDYGTVHGAIETGERAARAANRALAAAAGPGEGSLAAPLGLF